MTGLFSPTHYQGNQHSHHMRPYVVPYSSPCGNYHHKQTSPTTGDQPSYFPKSRKVITHPCPPGLEKSFPITYPSKNDIEKENLTSTVLSN